MLFNTISFGVLSVFIWSFFFISYVKSVNQSFGKGATFSRLEQNKILGVVQARRKEDRRGLGKTTKRPFLESPSNNYHVFAEWDEGHGGIPHKNMEVEVREEPLSGHRGSDPTALLVNNTPVYPMTEGPVVTVRVEEVLLVVLVLMIWVAAIALFFNRWGKIRMLEPYQPKFHQQPHRPSCPLAPLNSPPGLPAAQVSNNTLPTNRTQKSSTIQRMSFSKYNVNAMTDPLSALPSPIIRRPRQNSVFVGGSTMAILNPPRRAKSAMDIQHLLFNEHSPTSITGNRKGSVIPILNRDRRPSITIERPSFQPRYPRPSIIAIERPTFHLQQLRGRRSSCFVEKPHRSHRNFTSFDHDRKMSVTVDKPSHYQPTISFDSPITSEITVEVEEVPKFETTTKEHYVFPKISRSFEQPVRERPKPERMANSLDVSSVSFDERRTSIPEEEGRSSPTVLICLDEIKITAPLLEGLKSSDV